MPVDVPIGALDDVGVAGHGRGHISHRGLSIGRSLFRPRVSSVDQELGAWFRGGAEERMAFLASAEARLKTTTQRIVREPSMNVLAVTTAAADEVQAACIEGLQWLEEHKCPVEQVGDPMRDAFAQFRLAAETLIQMASGQLAMTAASGEVARQALARAQSYFYETATAFANAIGK
jgi:uncharacterized protein (DUF3084 family)